MGIASFEVRSNPCASLPPCARLKLGCPFVPEKLQRMFLGLEFVIDQAKTLLEILFTYCRFHITNFCDWKKQCVKVSKMELCFRLDTTFTY